MSKSSHGIARDNIDVHWLRKHPSLVSWHAPLYRAGELWQTAVVQGMNGAGRPDKSVWNVVTRSGSCPVYCVPDTLALQVSDTFATQDEALATLKDTPAAEWNRRSPFLQAFCQSPLSTDWEVGISEATALQALRHKQAVCIQAGIQLPCTVYAWVELGTEFMQMYSPLLDAFLDETMLKTHESFHRLQTYLRAVLLSRPNIVLIGKLAGVRIDTTTESRNFLYPDAHTLTMYVFDAVQFPQTEEALALTPVRAEFAQRPLIDRLMHLQAILQTEKRDYVGDCLMIAPFQPAYTRRDMKLHCEIFIDSCGFPSVIRRLSGASESVVD